MQMDSFLEDGSHEATVAVIRALSVAIPLTTSTLRDYILCQFYYVLTWEFVHPEFIVIRGLDCQYQQNLLDISFLCITSFVMLIAVLDPVE